MKIAVSYSDEAIRSHFGKTNVFQVFDTEGEASEEIRVEGDGHDVRVEALKANDIDAVICGGFGAGAKAALEEAGIAFAVSQVGSAEEALSDYLSDLLNADGAGCNCGGDCGCGDDEEGCGGGCGCGGAPEIIMEGKNAGKTCRVHYRGTLNDGTQFDASYDRGEPIEFICGAGQMIRGFDAAVLELEVGESVDIHLMPEDAYGMPDENAVFKIPMTDLPGSEELEIGQEVYVSNQFGQQFPVKVTAKDEQTITLDANHRLAGKELNFHIELVSVDE